MRRPKFNLSPKGDREKGLAKIAEDVAKRANYNSDMARYICYKMLAECNDQDLAMAFLKMCNEMK